MKQFIAVILLSIVAASLANANQQSSVSQPVNNPHQSNTSGDSELNLYSVEEKAIQLVAPSNDEYWYMFEKYNIQWISKDVSSVNISYSNNGGATWTFIAENIPALPNVYEWSVPYAASSDCFIRILDASDSTVSAMNTDAFTIAPYPNLTFPNGHEYIKAGENKTIYWNSAGIDSLKIEYTTDGGDSWHTIVESTDASSGEYDWLIPDILTQECYVKLTDTTDSLITFGSRYNNYIYMPITITSPSNGDVWQVGEEHTITWDGTWLANIVIQYSVNNGSTWNTLGTQINPDLGVYSWVLPDNPSNSCLMKIGNSVQTFGQSSDIFTIQETTGPPSVRLVSPNGGARFDMPALLEVKWTSINVEKINIEYSFDGSEWVIVEENLNAATGMYNWLTGKQTIQDISLRIVSTSDESVYDISEDTFSINAGLGITVLSPNCGETLYAGSQTEILWDTKRTIDYSQSIWEFNIFYSFDNGENWSEIAKVTKEIPLFGPAQFSYMWTVPDIDSESCLVKITTDSGPAIDDQSDEVFSISTVVGIAEEQNIGVYLTAACYPNPFNPRTTISYEIPQTADISLKIYNALGQQVREFTLGRLEPGTHNVLFDASDLTSGLYFYCINTGDAIVNGKMLYMK